jgi:hypothetical protein
MAGGGLTDIVRIRNGEVCYWPNLGYGRFGRKVCMDNAPWFDRPDLFDTKRLRLADIDGSGTTDIIYIGGDGIRLYFNQAGNAFGEPATVAAFPPINNLATVQALDLLGTGTACLVWTSSLPGDARRSMRGAARRALQARVHAGAAGNVPARGGESITGRAKCPARGRLRPGGRQAHERTIPQFRCGRPVVDSVRQHILFFA